MKNILSLFAASVLLSSCVSSKINNTLNKNLELAYQKESIKGFSVAVVNDKKLIYSTGYGFADKADNNIYDANTAQNIASISKTLIGISLLKAQELGFLKLEDSINKYLPFEIINPTHPDVPILVKHLAYHTSSISDIDDVYGKSYVLAKDEHSNNEVIYSYFNKRAQNITLGEFLKNSLSEDGKWYQEESFSKFKPGERREYSNIGASLCAYIIESASKQDYRSFTKTHILKPLKMNNSGWTSDDVGVNNRSRLFLDKEKMIAEYSLITDADGGFITSSNDLGLFLSELIRGYNGSGKLLDDNSYKKLFEDQKFEYDGKTENYGLFIEFRNGFLNVSNEMIGHNGSDPGVFSAMYFNPISKIGKIILVNTDTDYDDGVWLEIEEIWKSLSDFEKMIN